MIMHVMPFPMIESQSNHEKPRAQMAGPARRNHAEAR
jgi:hypothetical protein